MQKRICVVRVLLTAILFQEKNGICMSKLDEEDKNLAGFDAMLTGNALPTLRTSIRRPPLTLKSLN